MNRRTFLGTAVGLALASRRGDAAQSARAIPIIDTHIHIYDPFRPGGTPWPNKDNKVLFQTSLPGRYKSIAQPLGIVGAIAVEASSWVEDNQWVLDVAQQDDIMVGTVGRLVPGTPEFKANLDRFHKNPLFRGIRYGLGRQGGKEIQQQEFIADLKALAEADLVLDTANPTVSLLADVVRVNDHVPNLRVIIDHLPQMVPPTDTGARASYDASMNAFRERPQIYVKVSEVLRRVDGNIPTDLEFYRLRLDEILDVFGPDRVLYGSDWPNADQWLPLPVGLELVRAYFTGKGQRVAENYFWRNSVKCYKWVKRAARQPG